jgi:hypothetical protein
MAGCGEMGVKHKRHRKGKNTPDQEVMVAEFDKGNSGDKVRAKLRTFKGKAYADIRQHYTGENGKVIPTQKGLSVPIDQLPDLVKAVNALAPAASGFKVESTTQSGDVEF